MVPALVEHPPRKEPREGTGGQVPGVPGGRRNFPRRQPVGMLAEQGDNDTPAFLHLGVDSPEAEIFCGWLILPTCALPAADVAVEKVWAPSLSKIKYGVK